MTARRFQLECYNSEVCGCRLADDIVVVFVSDYYRPSLVLCAVRIDHRGSDQGILADVVWPSSSGDDYCST